MRFEAIVIAFTLIFVGHVQGRLDVPTPATQGVLANTPGLRGVQHGERLCSLFGAPIATHNNPATTDAFVNAHFAVQANRNALGVDGLILSDTFTRKIIANGNAFTVYTYDQWLPNDGNQDALPVYGMKVKVVVHHDAVEAMGYVGMRLVPNPEVPLPLDVYTDTAALGLVQALPSYSGLTTWSTPTKIAYQSVDGALHRTWHFRGAKEGQAFLFFVDTHSGELVDTLDLVLHSDVSGSVKGFATPCCLPGQPDWPACCPSGLPDCCCGETDPNYPECTYLCCAVDNPNSNDQDRYPVEKPLGGILVEARTVPNGVLLQEVHAEPNGSYLFTGLPGGDLEIRTKLESQYVIVESDFDSGEPNLVENDTVNGSQTGINFTFNAVSGFPEWPATLRTAQVNAFVAIQKTHDWFTALQQNYPGIDQQVRCLVNKTEGHGFGASYQWQVPPLIISNWQESPPDPIGYNNPSSMFVISHEYAHFIMDQTFDLALDNSFQEGIADTLTSLQLDTECVASDHRPWPQPGYVQPCLRNVERAPEGFMGFMDCDVNDCEVKLGETVRCDKFGSNNHCRGLALAGAFWDLQKMIGDSDAEKLFSRFVLVSDGFLDESVLSEVLTADDINATLADGTDHCAEILCAFVGNGMPCTVGGCSTLPTCAETGHGWACPTATTGLQVDWNHPTIDNPSPTLDYEVYDLVYPPSVLLKTSGQGITRWDIGRTVGGLAADIGTVAAEWEVAALYQSIDVNLGAQAGMPCRNVGVVDIPAQSAGTHSNIRFGLSGSLTGRARAYSNSTNQQGGRVQGSIAGNASRIVAQDVGSGATDGDILDVSGLTSFRLEQLTGQSQLVTDYLFPTGSKGAIINGLLEGDIIVGGGLPPKGEIAIYGSGTSTGSILVDGNIDGNILFVGNMAGDIIADADGDGTGAFLSGSHDQIIVQGLFTGNICGTNLSQDYLPPHIQLNFGSGGSICGTPFTELLHKKNRYLSFQPFSGSDVVAYRVNKTSAPTGSCWIGLPEPGFHTAPCVDSPVYRVWPEAIVNVGDCEIVPVANYEIRSTPDGVAFSAPISLQTIDLPSLNLKLWGDVVGVNNGTRWTAPNLFTNVHDVNAILSYVRGETVKPLFTAANLQAISSPDSCLNCFVNTADVLIVVRAIAGDSYGPPSASKIIDPANCPVCITLNCSQTQLLEGGEGGEEGFSGGGEGFFGPESFSSTPTFDLTVTPYQIDAEETATVSVYLDAAEVIGGYEVSLDATGGTTGTLTRETITINTNHNNFLFAGHATYLATNVESNMAGAVEAGGTGVVASSDEYLATYTFLASSDAEGVFEVRVSDDRSFILDEDGNQVAHDASVVAYVRVGVECTSAAHCDDGNQCTSDVCTSGACVNTNLTSGTACNDGLYCTLTDTCNGSGVCVGSAAKPCSKPNPVCCEATDSCHPSGHECELES